MAADAALSYVVQTLGNLLVEKVEFLRGVEGEVLCLRDELKRMQSFLKDAAEKQVSDERVRNGISEIREVALDSQDAIEMFVLNAQKARRRKLGFPEKFVWFPGHMYHINKIGEEIESIRKRLRNIESSLQTYGINIQDPLAEGGADSSSRRRRENVERRRRLAHWEDDKDVVGLDADVKLMVEKSAIEEKEGLAVATIVGMGGIGKTTLAEKIYNHAHIVDRFECRAWAAISSQFSLYDVVKQILLQLKVSLPVDNRLEMLQETLHKHLENKRYFIVLDDVCRREDLEALTSVFGRVQGKECRLLVTSRNMAVVADAQYIHMMESLTEEESWELFLNKAFVNGRCPVQLENIGREIVVRCRGLPLAINLAGGLLWAENESMRAWEKVLRQIQSYEKRDEERLLVILEVSYQNLLVILEVSYQNLPLYLKSCFLCLPSFREDAPILVKRLIQVWIAQDLVLQDEAGQETMEDVARGYLDELIARNLVQIEDKTVDGRVKTCEVHDLVRDLSIFKAKEEVKFEIIRAGESSGSLLNPRHCAIYCSEESFLDPTDQNDYLRSLFVHKTGEGVSLNPPSSFWKSFKLLKVLDMDDCGVRKLPDAIGMLFLLRYLGLRNTYINELPESMSKLENLQVLDSRGGYLMLPAFIWALRSLRHLNSSEIWLSQPVEKCTVENLQTLGDLVLEDDRMIEQLKEMTGLTKLGIILWSISDVRMLFESLVMLQNLSSLSLKSYFTLTLDGLGTLRRITKLKLEGHIDKLPSANDFPPNLSYLTLNRTALRVDPMPVLGELPVLLSLKLDYEAYRGEEMEILHDGFPRLQRIFLRGLGNLKKISAGEGAMPELQQWDVKECPNLSTENFPRSAVSGTYY